MSTFATPAHPASRPGRSLDGKVVLPGDAGFDDARRAWNLAIDQRPVAVAFPESAADVAAAVRYAAGRGLRVAAQGTGHNAGPLGSLADTVLVRTDKMRGIRIDPRSRTARVQAGVIWLDVVHAAAAHGLAALAGSSPDVGVTGYTLGGGLSFLGRKYGLAANNVIAAEVVGADGRLVRADAEHEPDLFWAVRGGGFGVVTALEFRLFPHTEAYAGALWYPIGRASEVLHAWAELTCGRGPDEGPVKAARTQPEHQQLPSLGVVMRSTTAQADIAATPAVVWAALTSPAQTQRYFAGLSITSTWRPDAAVDAHQGTTLIATGTVVVADKPSLLVYRLDEPQTGEIDCWLTWHLDQTEPGINRVTLTADTLPADPPVDAVRLLSNLKAYLETAEPLTPAA